jgi:glutaredoxin
VKEFLSREGYPFTVRNVEEDHDAYSALLALGFRAVPVTVIDGTAVKGFDEARLRDVLGAGGRP